MRPGLLPALVFFVVVAAVQGGNQLPLVRAGSPQGLALKTIESYQQIIGALPDNLRSVRPEKWTKAQREFANTTLREVFDSNKTPVKLRLKVAEVADWNGMTLYSEIGAHGGCHVRVFGAFTDNWKPQLATLRKGDMVTLEGVLTSAAYGDLWGQFTLSIIVGKGSFEK